MGTTSIGFGSLAAQANAAQSNESSLIQSFSSSNRPTDAAKIDKGAKEFEAVLVGSWLEQAEQSFATVPGADEDEQDVGRGSMMSLGVQTLATSMAATGGIGIGKMVAKAMHAAADKVAGQPTPASPDNVQAPQPAEVKHLGRTQEKRSTVD
jgi:Rod binding domain-containing protein